MDNLNKINKLSLPATIIITSIILGGFYYVSQINKQKSIEKQQQAQLESEKRNYIAERKRDCLNIYKTESDKWNNVESWNYIPPKEDKTDIGNLSSEEILNMPISDILKGDVCKIKYEGDNGEYFSRQF